MSQLNISTNNLSQTQPLRNQSPEGRFGGAPAQSSLGNSGGAGVGNLIFTLQNEAADMRKRVSACRSLEDQINNFQLLLNAESNNRRASEEEGRARLDSSATFIAALRAEVEAQRRQLAERRRQNGELADELRRTQDQVDVKRADNGRLRLDLLAANEQNELLTTRKRQLIDDSVALRDRNARDTGDIDSMNIQNEQKQRECADL